MAAALAFLKATFGLLAKVPWWVWPIVALAWWGAAGRMALRSERVERANEQQTHVAAIAKLKADALATESEWKGRVDEQRRAKETAISEINAVHAADLVGLRDRAARRADLPGAATASCQGATGAELSGPDARFLAGEAARANQLRSALAECYQWIDTVTAPRSTQP